MPETPAWFFGAGTAFHRTTEDYDRAVWNGERPAASTLIEGFDRYLTEFEAEAAQIEPDRSLWRRGGRASAAWPDKETGDFYRAKAPEWCENYDKHSRTSGEVLWTTSAGEPAIEFVFTIILGGVPVKGAIDRAYVHPQGMLGIRDIKTGTRIPAAEQLGLYACALEMLQDIRPSFGDFYDARKGVATPPVGLDNFSIDFFHRQFAAFDAQRRTGLALAKVSDDCGRCGVKRYCPAWGGPDAIQV